MIYPIVGEETTFNIDSLTYTSSEFVVENKIAPSASGYFDVTIDPTGSDVAVRFDVILDVANLNIIDAIQFTNAYRIINRRRS